jgi:membrane protein DedA with SNARE-associated domain
MRDRHKAEGYNWAGIVVWAGGLGLLAYLAYQFYEAAQREIQKITVPAGLHGLN